MLLRQLDVHMQKSQFSRGYTPFTRINLKWMIGLNVKQKLVKLPKQNIRKNLGELGFEFLDTSGEGNSNPLQHSCLENPIDGGA